MPAGSGDISTNHAGDLTRTTPGNCSCFAPFAMSGKNAPRIGTNWLPPAGSD